MKILKESGDSAIDVVDIAVDKVVDNFVSGELGNLAQEISSLGKGYNSDWCADDASDPTSVAVDNALEALRKALKDNLLANYKSE